MAAVEATSPAAAVEETTPAPSVEEIFKQIDSDQDGMITVAELQDVIKKGVCPHPMSEEEVVKFFEEADADKDGKINLEELKKLLVREA